MKTPTLEQFTQDPQGYLEAAQQEHVLITRNGLPFAVVVGIENKDEEDWQLQLSPEFWRIIEASRRETATISLEEFMADLEVEEKNPSEGRED